MLENRKISVHNSLPMNLVGTFLLLVGLTTSSCDTPPPIHSEVAVFVDLTEVEERGGTQLESDTFIHGIFDLVANSSNEEDRSNAASISFYTLSDESLLRSRFQEDLEAGSRAENRLNRMDAVREFEASALNQAQGLVEEILVEAGADSSTPILEGYQQSHIVRPVCEYLRTVNSGTAQDRRYLVIFSDLLENSPVYSFFKAPGPQDDALAALMGECSGVQAPLGIKYQVLTQPLGIGNSELSDLQFQALQIWRMLFDKLGLIEDASLLN